MIFLRKPSDAVARRFVESHSSAPFNYEAVGATAAGAPAGFTIDHNRTRIGSGAAAFHSAAQALRAGRHYDVGWIEPVFPDRAVRPGDAVATLARSAGLWWLNACRIVYVIEEDEPVRRYGYAYGTLPGHVAMGEERFLVEWDQTDDSVWFDIYAFSRPVSLLARIGYPWFRTVQKRFGPEVTQALVRAMEEPGVSAVAGG